MIAYKHTGGKNVQVTFSDLNQAIDNIKPLSQISAQQVQMLRQWADQTGVIVVN